MEPKRITRNSLGWLEEICFSDGPAAAIDEFKRQAPASAQTYSVIRFDQRQHAFRTDVEDADRIAYESFDAPAFWEVPYALLKARFAHVPKTDFIYHGGEETLIPTAGEVFYHFYGPADAKRPRRFSIGPLKPGSIVSLNPQIPHHTWGGPAGGEAWMIIRHLSDTPASISVTSSSSNTDFHPTPRRITAKQLKLPGVYSLIAWGISERIRLCRERAGARVNQLAQACGIDPSHWSRIENADTNVSLDTLMRVAQLLGISLDELVAPPSWTFRENSIPAANRVTKFMTKSLPPNGLPHSVHLTCWTFPAGYAHQPETGSADRLPSSWIMLRGRSIFDIPSNGRDSSELLEEGSVLHVRHGMPGRIQALEQMQVLKVTYSPSSCLC